MRSGLGDGTIHGPTDLVTEAAPSMSGDRRAELFRADDGRAAPRSPFGRDTSKTGRTDTYLFGPRSATVGVRVTNPLPPRLVRRVRRALGARALTAAALVLAGFTVGVAVAGLRAGMAADPTRLAVPLVTATALTAIAALVGRVAQDGDTVYW